jgi:transposase
MLSLSPEVSIYLCVPSTDMRRGFDGLLAMAREHLTRDPLAGGLYVFLNRRRDRVKLLWWDGDGLVVWYKRLESGTFERPRVDEKTREVILPATDLALLLGGIELASVRRRKRYQHSPKIHDTSSAHARMT